MSAIKLNSSGGGSITISPASTASTLTLTAPAQTGTIGLDGPAFSAYQSVTQTLSSGAATKIQFQTEEFDTASCFDNTTNYRFTPNVAGYYQISAALAMGASPTGVQVILYKNGSAYRYIYNTVTTTVTNGGQGSCLVYLNGSTDYIEIYGIFATGQVTLAGSLYTYFQAALVRGAA